MISAVILIWEVYSTSVTALGSLGTISIAFIVDVSSTPLCRSLLLVYYIRSLSQIPTLNTKFAGRIALRLILTINRSIDVS